MVANGKPKLSEMKAAALANKAVMYQARDVWDTVYGELRSKYGHRFFIQDQAMARYDLALAAVALELEAVGNLFAADQAARIVAWTEHALISPQIEDYGVEEVRAYRAVFQRELQLSDGPMEAVCGVAFRLLVQWLGEDVRRFEIEIPPVLGIFADPIINPSLVSEITGYVCGLTGEWRAISDHYELEPEDLPFNQDWDAYGFYQPGYCPRPPPPRKSLMARLSLAAAPAGAYLVSIKGPWVGVRENVVYLTAELATRYVDAHGYAHALCHFKQGQAQVYLAPKALWKAESWADVDWAEAHAASLGLQRMG